VNTIKTLAGRIALVTGGGSGIGRVISLALAREGAEIVICGRNVTALQEAKREIPGSCFFSLDATKPEEVKNLFRATIEAFGKLDILVNNIGGVNQFEEFPNLTDADWQEAFDLNVMSTVRFTREAIPWLEKSKYASIVNISSVSGKKTGNYNFHYCAAKAAQLSLNQALSGYLAPKRIRVNAVCPSTVKGEGMWERDIEDLARRKGLTIEAAREHMEEGVQKKIPLGKICTPEDVAEAVVFLASDKARFITGTAMMVDGGISRL
jgi:NAD(P)-dependent dehydrogenase (short-subunit alcohol dehydrogenase family)